MKKEVKVNKAVRNAMGMNRAEGVMREIEAHRNDMVWHWMNIINAVFSAEASLPELDKWNELLEKAKTAEPDERKRICEGYVRAIAEEILTNAHNYLTEY